jgi:sugar lactone lactonase YvrE
VDSSGNVYVGDHNNNRIRKITPAGIVSTLAGGDTSGSADGTGAAAEFTQPSGVAVDASGTVYVIDYNDQKIRKITPAGVVTTFAGSGHAGYADGTGAATEFSDPTGIAVDGSGNIYVCDKGNQRIREISPAGVVTTIAGDGVAGYADSTNPLSAEFMDPSGIALDAAGNLYIADANNERIRKMTPAGVVSTLAGSATRGYAEGVAAVAEFGNPQDVAVDASGNVYVADVENNRVRRVTPAGTVTTYAGNGEEGVVDGPASVAEFEGPEALALDSSGNLYVADGSRIRKITPL